MSDLEPVVFRARSGPFTGIAGSGESHVTRYPIENDAPDAVIKQLLDDEELLGRISEFLVRAFYMPRYNADVQTP